MNRTIAPLLLLVVGCAPISAPIVQKANMDAKPVALPYPGIYTGTVKGGTLTYRIDANGRGLSCIRKVGGGMMYGDVIYDGATVHTEDGDLEVVSVSPTELRVKTAYLSADLRKVDAPPTTCADFLK